MNVSADLVDTTTDPRCDTTFVQDGFTLRIWTEPDYDSSTVDDDGATSAQLAAFERGDWQYVGCRVTASRCGVLLGTASLWSIESGWFTYTDDSDRVTGQGYVGPYTEAVDDLVAEAIEAAQATLAELNREA